MAAPTGTNPPPRRHSAFAVNGLAERRRCHSAPRLEPATEMPQELRLPRDFVAPQLLLAFVDLENRLHHIVDVALCVDPPRNRQPQQLMLRVRAEHHRSD